MQSPIPLALTILTFLPLLGAIVVMLLPRPQDLPDDHSHHDDAPDHSHGHRGPAQNPQSTTQIPEFDTARTLVNGIALFFAFATLLISLAVFGAFDSGYTNAATRNMQFVEDIPWITFGNATVHYKMGIDGVSLLLVVLTAFLSFLCILYSTGMKQRVKEFMVFLLLMEAGMIGVFCALDLVLFYFFYELVLIPMYFLIGIFGHENRIYAAIKFFLYTFAGSVFMLLAIAGLYQITGTFDIIALSNQGYGPGQALRNFGIAHPQIMMWLFAAFALAFIIKVPMFPFHTWLPDAHVEAPTAGSVILAGILLKLGTYGLVRICLPLFPSQAVQAGPIFVILAIVGIIYGSMVAAVQPDAKKLVAYSSVAHMGFVVLGIFSFTRIGMMGALIQNINHGISTPMLFFLVGMLYERRHTRLIAEFGGLRKIVPMLATMTLIATFSSIAVPFFNGFVGEFPILVGSWTSTSVGFGPTALAATGMILSAVYMLWWFQRIMLGPVTKAANRHLPDLSRTEWAVLLPLAAIIFWIGLGSHFWTQRMDTSVVALIHYSDDHMDTDLPIASRLTSERGMSETKRPRPGAPLPNPPETEIGTPPPGQGPPTAPGSAAPVPTPGSGPPVPAPPAGSVEGGTLPGNAGANRTPPTDNTNGAPAPADANRAAPGSPAGRPADEPGTPGASSPPPTQPATPGGPAPGAAGTNAPGGTTPPPSGQRPTPNTENPPPNAPNPAAGQ